MSDQVLNAPSSNSRCANCGTSLQGAFCSACGQPVEGLIRHLSGILGDFLDSVLNFDSRTLRTLWPLFARPGFLTLEYFAGRRVRYVTPLRLFFFLSVVSFFAAQLYLDVNGAGVDVNFDGVRQKLATAQTPEDVQKERDKTLADIRTRRNELKASGALDNTDKALEAAEAAVNAEAKQRLDFLHTVDEAKAKGLSLPPNPFGDKDFSFDDPPWDPQSQPIRINWLPAAGNAKLNEIAGRMKQNLIKARHEPKRLVAGLFGVLPQTLFALMPLFAVLLKIVYLFKRRLYMEHLIVALHSHAFIFFALLLMALAGLGQLAARTAMPGLANVLGWTAVAIGVWSPAYLFLMQKRVYGQGWIMTTLKYGLVGFCYVIMIVCALVAAFVVSLAVD